MGSADFINSESEGGRGLFRIGNWQWFSWRGKVISQKAVVETDEVGEGTSIGDFAVVAAGASLGRGCIIHPFAVINTGVVLGDKVEVLPGAVLGREPNGAGAAARQPVFERSVRIGEECSIGPHAVIYYDVVIGRNCLIGDGASVREDCVIGDRCLIGRYVTVNYETKIGSRTKIMDLTHITGRMEIGDDVFISVLVSTTNDNAIGAHGYREDEIRGPRIADGAMIGCGAKLLPGVEIGRGAIVGAGTVVTKSVPEGKVMMGVPGRIVRDA
jgi:UDP-3-O-[3-hydroxymyristoyl] glucosamine N-acyltransferase